MPIFTLEISARSALELGLAVPGLVGPGLGLGWVYLGWAGQGVASVAWSTQACGCCGVSSYYKRIGAVCAPAMPAPDHHQRRLIFAACRAACAALGSSVTNKLITQRRLHRQSSAAKLTSLVDEVIQALRASRLPAAVKQEHPDAVVAVKD